MPRPAGMGGGRVGLWEQGGLLQGGSESPLIVLPLPKGSRVNIGKEQEEP